MKSLFFYIYMMMFYICQGQNLSTEIREIIDGIAQSKNVTGKYIGYGSSLSKQYQRFKLLDSLASIQEIKYLLKNESPVVRCAAFSSLCKRDIFQAFYYLNKAIYEETFIDTQYGCIGSKIGDIYLEKFSFGLLTIDSMKFAKIQPKLTELDSTIIHDSRIKLAYKSSRIKSLKPTYDNYDLIRNLALTKAEPFAVITLAKYNKLEDRKIIINWLQDPKNLYYGICAVKEFPEPIFYPFLLEIFRKKWKKNHYSYATWRVLYQALAKYPDNPETINLFDKTIYTRNKFRRETLSRYLLIAITKYPSSKFKKYNGKIKLSEFHANFFNEELEAEN